MKRYDYCNWGRLALRGPDRARFLHGMVTCDVEKMPVGGGNRAAMLSVKGRLLATFVVYARPDELVLSLEPGLGEKVRVLLEKHLVMDDVEVVDRNELEELGLYGDDAASFIADAIGIDAAALGGLPPYHQLERGGVLVARDASLGEVGFRIIGTGEALSKLHHGELLTDEEREERRIAQGTARYGIDLDEDRLVVEANLEDALSFDKGCYLGQEVVVRATSRGRVNRKLVGLVLSGEGAIAAATKLFTDAMPEAGLITSSVGSSRFGAIALAYVHRNALDAAAPLSVGDRSALVVPLPFSANDVAAARARLPRDQTRTRVDSMV